MAERIECKAVTTYRAVPANRKSRPPRAFAADETGRQHGRDMPPWPGRAVIQAEVRQMNIR
jgi:hypothetical protein